MKSPNQLLTWSFLASGVLFWSLDPLHSPAPGRLSWPNVAVRTTPPDAAGPTDFDFEVGTWQTRLSRLQAPLTGSTTWVKYQGTTVVRQALNGRANLAELAVAGPAGRLEGVSLRLYNPQTQQWSLNFANARDGRLTVPAVGSFKNGRGEFYNDDVLNGQKIRVRFIVSGITANSCRFEQAFSADGGKTWEVNWVATDTRVKPRKF
jgi:hypothetical protein